MLIRKESVAGTVESSDVMVYVAPAASGVSLEVNSSSTRKSAPPCMRCWRSWA